MNVYLRAFQIVVWIGIAANAAFWIPAWFHPPTIVDLLGIDEIAHPVWLRNVGMLLVVVSLFNAVAAWRPDVFPLLAWLVVVSRLLAGLFHLEVWLVNSFDSASDPAVMMWFFVGDTTFGVVTGILLYLGLRGRPVASQQG